MTLKQQQYTKHNMKTKLSKYEEESLGTNGSKGYGVRVSVSNSSYMAHQDSSEQRDREQRIRKSRLASPTSTSSSPVPQGRLKQMSPSEMLGFLGGANEPSNRPYLTSQLINKENTSNVSTSSPSHFYAASESQSSASMIESSRDRQDRNNGYNNANSHTHYHNRHASQIDHHRSGKIFVDIFGLPITVSVVKSGFSND